MKKAIRRRRLLIRVGLVLPAIAAALWLVGGADDDLPFIEAVPDDARGYAGTPDLWDLAEAPCVRDLAAGMIPRLAGQWEQSRERLRKALAGEAAVAWGFEAATSGRGVQGPPSEGTGNLGPGSGDSRRAWVAFFRLTRTARAGLLFGDAPGEEAGQIDGVAVLRQGALLYAVSGGVLVVASSRGGLAGGLAGLARAGAGSDRVRSARTRAALLRAAVPRRPGRLACALWRRSGARDAPDVPTGVALDLLGAGGRDGDFQAAAGAARDVALGGLWVPLAGSPPSPVPGPKSAVQGPLSDGTLDGGRTTFDAPALFGSDSFFIKSRRVCVPDVWKEWLDELADEYGRAVPAAGGEPGETREAAARVEVRNEVQTWERLLFEGKSFEKDVLPLFGPEVGLALTREDYSSLAPPPKHPLPVLWAFCEVRDLKAASVYWDRLLEHYAVRVQRRATEGGEREGPFKVVRTEAGGMPVTGLELQGEAARDMGPALRPAYAVVDKFLVIASYRPALERRLKRAAPALSVAPGLSGPFLGGAATGWIQVKGVPLAAGVRDIARDLADLAGYDRLRARVAPDIERRVGEELRRQAESMREERRGRFRKDRPGAVPIDVEREVDRQVNKWLWEEFNRRVELAIQAEATTEAFARTMAEARADVEAWARAAERLGTLHLFLRDAPDGRRFLGGMTVNRD